MNIQKEHFKKLVLFSEMIHRLRKLIYGKGQMWWANKYCNFSEFQRSYEEISNNYFRESFVTFLNDLH